MIAKKTGSARGACFFVLRACIFFEDSIILLVRFEYIYVGKIQFSESAGNDNQLNEWMKWI